MTTTTTSTTTIYAPKWPTWVIAEPSSANPSSPKYPLLPHARTNDLRKALLSAWADEKQHWRISELVLGYLVKHPGEKMGAYEKERFNAAIDAVVEAMAKGQTSWGGWGFYFACLMDKLQNMKVDMKDPSFSPDPVIKKEEDD